MDREAQFPTKMIWSQRRVTRGVDTPEFYREDILLRIKQLESEANDGARRMNDITRKNNLPEELVEERFPEDDDTECE